MNQDKVVAVSLLRFRTGGYSILYAVRKSAVVYVIHMTLLALALAALVCAHDYASKVLPALLTGMLLGAVLRDVGWLRKGKRQWPLMMRILDWSRVESVANGEDVRPDARFEDRTTKK